MSRTSWDVRRSIRRYVGEFLPNDWDVRITPEEATWARPSAIVDYASPQILTGGPKVFDVARTFVIYAYPEGGSSANASVEAADATEEMFVQALQIGGKVTGRPRRIPLWNYDDVELGEPTDLDAQDGYVRVKTASVNQNRDPDDERLFTVISEIRVDWRRLGEPMPEYVLLDHINYEGIYR